VGGGPATPAATPADRLRAASSAAAANNEAEVTLWHGSYSPKAMYGSWALATLATVAALIASVAVSYMPVVPLVAFGLVGAYWLWLVAYLVIARLSVDYTLTNQRFIHKTGLLRQVTNRLEVIDIDDVTFEQGIFERLFGVGTIRLLSSDVSDPKLTLRGIDDVHRVATLIDNARREERRKRGLYMESV
jgi:uncharacterized membrane protein YdbT with pleckstrin-like domain